MSKDTRTRTLARVAAGTAIAFGFAAGSYGVAGAASGSGSSGNSTSTAAGSPSTAADSQGPRGGQRSDETLLTGDTAEKVRAAALAELDGATIERVETDADGHAAYEAHVVKSDGTPATVYVNEQFEVVSVESRGSG
jgi:hypothetical protein